MSTSSSEEGEEISLKSGASDSGSDTSMLLTPVEREAQLEFYTPAATAVKAPLPPQSALRTLTRRLFGGYTTGNHTTPAEVTLPCTYALRGSPCPCEKERWTSRVNRNRLAKTFRAWVDFARIQKLRRALTLVRKREQKIVDLQGEVAQGVGCYIIL